MSKQKSVSVAEKRDWLVDGVPQHVRDLACEHALTSDLSLGDWLIEAIVAYAKSGRMGLSSVEATVPPIDLSEKRLAEKVGEIDRRLAQLEARIV